MDQVRSKTTMTENDRGFMKFNKFNMFDILFWGWCSAIILGPPHRVHDSVIILKLNVIHMDN